MLQQWAQQQRRRVGVNGGSGDRGQRRRQSVAASGDGGGSGLEEGAFWIYAGNSLYSRSRTVLTVLDG